MSLYIGKDNDDQNIMHLTSASNTLNELKGGALQSSVLYSKALPVEVIYEETIQITIYNDTYGSYSTSYTDNTLMSYLFGSDKHLFLLSSEYNGTTTTSGVFECDDPSIWASVGIPYYDSSEDKCWVQVNGDNLDTNATVKVTFCILSLKVGDTLLASDGPISISSSNFSIGSYDIKNKKILCHSPGDITGEKVFLTAHSDEDNFSYKNYSNLVNSFSCALHSGLIQRGGEDFIGGNSGKILIPIAMENAANCDDGETFIYNSNYAIISNNVLVYFSAIDKPHTNDVSILYGYNNISKDSLVRCYSNSALLGSGGTYDGAKSKNITFDRTTGDVEWNTTSHVGGGTFTFLYFY